MNLFEELKNYDTEVAAACHAELERQQHNIELIASENIVSKGVLLAAGSAASAITAAANVWMWLKTLQESAQKSFSAQSTQMFSRTAAQALILPYFSPFYSPVIRLWV